MNFMKWQWLYFTISLFFLIPGIGSLVINGLEPSIDFTGGSLWEVRVQPETELSTEQVNQIFGEQFVVSSVQSSGENTYILRGGQLAPEIKRSLSDSLTSDIGAIEELRFEVVGPAISQELLTKTMAAIIMVAGLITLYVWYQFNELKYGISAILAMFHDSLILLGTFSLLGHFWGVEVDVLFVTALLTTLSFSIHDTIVVYDRIRELRRKHRNYDYVALVNAAVTETLGRSINNSVTIILMLLALVLLGGDTIRWFGVALLVGAVTGTYSSTFTAAPLLLVWDQLASNVKSKRKDATS